MPEEVPKETETIAAKRAFRVAEKLRLAGSKISRSSAWWNSFFVEVVFLFLMVGINFYTVWHLWGKASGNDIFYSGPGIPFLAKLLEFFNINLSTAFQYVNIVFFVIFPSFLYIFIKSITDRKIIGFLAVIISSLPFFPFSYTRLQGSFYSVDSAHISSLPVMMIALIGVLFFIRNGGSVNLVISSVFSGLVALFSPFAFMNFIIFSSILTFSEVLLGSGRLKFFRFVGVLFFSGTLIAFWYNPSFAFWIFTGFLGKEVRETVSRLIPVSLFVLPILGTFGYLLFDRKPALQTLFLASFFTICFGLISVVGSGFVPSHPGRYFPELGISLSILISIVIVRFFESIPLLNDNKFIARSLIVLVSLVLITIIPIFGGNYLQENDDLSKNVLGAWDGVSRGTVWQERDRFNGANNIVGFGVSLSGIMGLSYICLKYKL